MRASKVFLDLMKEQQNELELRTGNLIHRKRCLFLCRAARKEFHLSIADSKRKYKMCQAAGDKVGSSHANLIWRDRLDDLKRIQRVIDSHRYAIKTFESPEYQEQINHIKQKLALFTRQHKLALREEEIMEYVHNTQEYSVRKDS